MTPGRIILLNGTSSSGKGAIAAALVDTLPAPYVHIGFDDLVHLRRNAAYFGEPGFNLRESNAGAGGPITMEIGLLGLRFFSGMHHAVRAFASVGNNLIVDEVLWDPDWLQEYVEILDGYRVLFVGVLCPLAVAEERERARGDRLIGLARSQFDHVHAHGVYDLTVNTSVTTPVECAARIAQAEIKGEEKAFAQLRCRFGG